LDTRNQDRVLEAIDLASGHLDTSMIYVTHETDELPKSITHVLNLDGGEMVGKEALSGVSGD